MSVNSTRSGMLIRFNFILFKVLLFKLKSRVYPGSTFSVEETGGGGVCHFGHAEESGRAGLQARKGQTQRQDGVGEGRGPNLMNIIMEGVSFYIPSAFHRTIRT